METALIFILAKKFYRTPIISKQIVKAVKQGKYKELEPEIAYINQSFQQHLKARYGS